MSCQRTFWNACILTLAALIWFCSTVCFYVVPQGAFIQWCIITLVAFSFPFWLDLIITQFCCVKIHIPFEIWPFTKNGPYMRNAWFKLKGMKQVSLSLDSNWKWKWNCDNYRQQNIFVFTKIWCFKIKFLSSISYLEIWPKSWLLHIYVPLGKPLEKMSKKGGRGGVIATPKKIIANLHKLKNFLE